MGLNHRGTETQKNMPTIADLLAAAPPGAEVFIPPGVYTEAVRIVKPVLLTGRDVTIIAPADLAPDAAVVTVHAVAGVELRYLEVHDVRPKHPDHFECCCIAFEGGATAGKVLSCTLHGAAHCAVKEMGHGGAGFTIRANRIYDCGATGQDHGIYLPGPDSDIEDNDISRCVGYGIHSYSGSGQARGHRIVRNRVTECGGGVLVDSDGCMVLWNELHQNEKDLVLYGCSRGLFIGNTGHVWHFGGGGANLFG
jgi:hypothetical protein